MTWTFDHPARLVFGRGAIAQIPGLVASRGRRILLITGAGHAERSGLLERLLAALHAAGGTVVQGRVDREPDDRLVDALAAEARTRQAEVILALGGGSAIDAAKAVAALARNPGRCADYLEGLPGPGPRSLGDGALPVIACPTTAGTGAEATMNAVILARDHGVKRSLRDPAILPAIAVVDPDLVDACPPAVAAAAGFDALSHLAEAFCSTQATPMTDALAEAGLRAARDFLTALAAGAPAPAQVEAMCLAATWGGICLAHARLGAAHGLVAPLCGRHPVGHGHAIACLLPPVLTANHAALTRAGRPTARLDRLARLLGHDDLTAAAASLAALRRRLGLAGLSACGLTEADLPALAAAPSSSIRTNPVVLPPDVLTAILRESLA